MNEKTQTGKVMEALVMEFRQQANETGDLALVIGTTLKVDGEFSLVRIAGAILKALDNAE